MFGELPVELKFQIRPSGALFIPGLTVPVEIALYGDVTFLFEETDRPEILSVGLQAVWWRLAPFIFPFDVDGDGLLEAIEVDGIQIGREWLDLEACKGSLNRETGEFGIDWVFEITPKELPLLEQFGGEPIRLTISDRGYMDLTDGSFEIHIPGGVHEITEGPLAGVVVRGSATGFTVPTSSVKLGVVIAAPGITNCGTPMQKLVTVCPGDQILLCWEASDDVQTVDISPGGYVNHKPTSTKTLTPPAPAAGAKEIEYRVRTIGGNSQAEDTVTVRFYQDNDWLEFEAPPVGHRWHIEISPSSLSGTIVVEEIQLLRGGKCLDWKKFSVEHIFPPFPVGPTGKVSKTVTIDGFQPESVGIPYIAAGDWDFYPMSDPQYGSGIAPDPKDIKDPVCFQLRGACRS